MPRRNRNRTINLKPGKSRTALTITHPNAAGIDIGSASHFVAVPPERDDEPVREFPSFTDDLNALVDWLDACGVESSCHGIHGCVLDSLVRSTGITRFHRIVNQRTSCQERLGP